MAIANLWTFSFRVTTNTDDITIGYQLGRQAMERVKMAGFSAASEGSSTNYYTGDQVLTSSTSPTRRYAVTTNIVSDQVTSGTSGVAGAVPADGALRTVTITVQLIEGGQVVRTLYQTSTYLAKAGI